MAKVTIVIEDKQEADRGLEGNSPNIDISVSFEPQCDLDDPTNAQLFAADLLAYANKHSC